MATNLEVFNEKYINFQRTTDAIEWIKRTPNTKPFSTIGVHVFIAFLQPHANQKNLDEIQRTIDFLQGEDIDKDDVEALINKVIHQFPALSHYILEIDKENIVIEEAIKFCRYLKLFIQILIAI